MLALHEKHKLPIAAFWYSSIPAIVVAACIVGIAIVASTLPVLCNESGCTPIPAAILLPVAWIVALLVVLQPILYYILFSYSLTENTITVNTGILFRQYETIDFSRIQTIDNERNPIHMLFGLTDVRIWTASADQLNFSSQAGGVSSRPRPDTTLLLGKATAVELRDLVMRTKHPAQSAH